MSTKAIIAVLAASICASAPSSRSEIRIGDTPARRIARETLPGKNEDGQCLPFARALHARLRAAGIPSKIITFNYETLSTPHDIFGEHRAVVPYSERGGITGAHAVVEYEDMGRVYIMDNQSWQPMWVHNDSALGMARQFAGMDTLVAGVRTTDRYRSSNAWAAKMRAAQILRSSNALAARARAAQLLRASNALAAKARATQLSRASSALAARTRAAQLFRTSSALAARTRDSHFFRAHAPALRQQYVARSNAPGFRLRAGVQLRHGFFAWQNHKPLRKEDLLKRRSLGYCHHHRRRHYHGTLFAFR